MFGTKLLGTSTLVTATALVGAAATQDASFNVLHKCNVYLIKLHICNRLSMS